jgi:LysM repeat protein
MTERGLPIVGGAPACPFVAFEDDRDERATSPDHRHRCYAEAQPAPRALAHQEAYCLSSAFPVCPTFQDWARREAARARPPDLPPDDDEAEDDGIPALVDDRPPRRSSRDRWAAPPPWLNTPGTGAPAPQQEPPAAAGAAAGGMAGAALGGGLAGGFADRLVSDAARPARPDAGSQRADEPARYEESPQYHDERPRHEDDNRRDLDESGDEDEAPAAGPRGRRRERLEAGSDRMESSRDHDIAAPSWERPRRLEAYPTLRSQRWSSTVLPTVGLALIALLLAAAALFFVPQLLGVGGPGPAASPTAGVAASVAPSAQTFAPSELPAATPFLYQVKSGDTIFGIAKRFGVDYLALIDANKAKYPDPNKINVGDFLVIPAVPASAVPGAS